MGSPIGHSLSPALHRAAYDGLGLTTWEYDRLEVGEAELAAALARVATLWVGASLTMPLKHAAVALMDEVSELAREVGAVNTVTFRDGRRLGDNTDVHGIVDAFLDVGVRSAEGAVVLGGGATAASAIAALRELGERRPAVVVRSPERAAALLAAAERLDVTPEIVGWEHAARRLAGAPVAISTVPKGAADSVANELRDLVTGAATAAPGRGVLLDVVYRPWPTALASAWAERGGVVVPGLEMLVHQAAAQVRAWTGALPDIGAMRQAGLMAGARATDNG